MKRPIVSQAAELLYAKLWPHTLEDEQNGWHLLLFCDSIASVVFEPIRRLVADTPISSGSAGSGSMGGGDVGGEEKESMVLPGWAIVFNADLCPAIALPYLAQFVGLELDPKLSIEEQRLLIKNRPNFRRGTVGAVTSAAALHLTGTKTVAIFERLTGPYNLTIRTFLKETPDPAQTLRDILTQKPAGIQLDYQAFDGRTYIELKEKYGTYEVMRKAGTYQTVRVF